MDTAIQRSKRRGVRAISLVLWAVAAAGTGGIGAGVPGARFQIDAHVVSNPTPQTGGGLDLQGTLSVDRSSLAGGSYSLSANALASPDGCASDTIFANGFDP